MRLLKYDDSNNFSLAEFFERDIPKYAILSHRWGVEEVTFKDLTDGTGKNKAGYDKIRFCGEQAKRDGLQYFWVDTGCIDKTNSTELMEAINSMFRWYQNATKCYVYLLDVSRPGSYSANGLNEPWELEFRRSEWFTRGWTLQELIAPASVEFFSKEGELLGNKTSLEDHICEITRIPAKALRGSPLPDFSVSERMSWAENRETCRPEDKVYSLLGIFDVSMPFMYGEEIDKTFQRLLDELYRREKKRSREELSTVLPLTSSSTKRLKTSHWQSSIPSRNSTSLKPEPPIYSEHSATTKQSLIDQLYFTKIDERLTSLTAAQGKTCRWFLAKSEYTSWNDVSQQPDHNGFLWIKGNPGTGKSTLMKSLFEKTKLGAKCDPSQITLSFFFLARGTVEEKSATGLYRSLIHQLFEKAVESRDSLEWITADGARFIERDGWHEEALKQTLTHAVEKLTGRSLTVFVDALDECDDNQAAGMVCYFEELCDRAREAQVQLQICFSSRHYPSIVIQKGLEVTLEDEIGHAEDIRQYIESTLKVGKTKKVEILQSEILEKSSRIFLWVVLVIDILNSEYRNGSAFTKIRERLKEIPPKLTDLFEMILTRDGDNLELLQVCLKWILFAIRPFKPQELYFAVQSSLDKECSGFWDQEDVDLEQIKTFVRSSSKGLAEVTRNRTSEVQFIHESVRDFLLGKYGGQWSGISGNFVGDCHEKLKDCCLAQLNAPINKDIDIPDPLPQASKAAKLRETICLRFPFLEYSVLYVLHHANAAQQNSIVQGNFLTKLPFQQWKYLNNVLERYEIRRYNDPVSILYILAERNLAHLIRIHPQRESCFDVGNGRYGPPLFAALATGSIEAVRVLLNIEVENQPPTSPLHDLCKQYCQDGKKWTNLGRDFTFSKRRTVSSYATEYDDDILFCFLIELGLYIPESRDRNKRDLLSWASEHRYAEVVKLLLEKGADLEVTTSNDRQTPLHIAASEYKNVEVVKLLLEKGANLEATTSDGRTPLQLAVSNRYNNFKIVKLLLEKGANSEAATSDGRTPLHIAVSNEYNNFEVVKLLLEKGANLEATTSDGRTPLHLAASSYHTLKVVELLLENRANLEATTSFGQTPLHLAASRYDELELVRLLVEKGANLKAVTSDGHTPLHLAASVYSNTEVVELLLEKGANLDATTNNGQTPLHIAASEYKNTKVVQLLLQNGANLEATTSFGQTPLQLASKYGRDDIVELLEQARQNREVAARGGGEDINS